MKGVPLSKFLKRLKKQILFIFFIKQNFKLSKKFYDSNLFKMHLSVVNAYVNFLTCAHCSDLCEIVICSRRIPFGTGGYFKFNNLINANAFADIRGKKIDKSTQSLSPKIFIICLLKNKLNINNSKKKTTTKITIIII